MDRLSPVTIAALAATAQLVHSGKTDLGWASFTNPGTAMAYVQMFDAVAATGAGSPTLGTTPPSAVVGIPAGGTVTIDPEQLGFFNGLVVACTATANGSGAPNAANVCSLGIAEWF